jgi:hypothetical protein
MNLVNKLSLFILTPILLFTVSCSVSDSNSGGEKRVAVKMKLNQTSTATAKQISSSPTAQSVDSLTEIKLLVEELELESTVDEDSLDFEVNDFVASLPLDGSEIEISTANVPAGVYDEFEMEIEHDDDTNVNDSDFNNESGDGYSIVIKGVYNGEDFMYRSEEDFEIELEFNPPFEINDGSPPSVAINVDPSGWFKDSSGNDLDPTDPANQEQIDENIENSFEVEEDNDDDDSDDDDSDDDDD